MACFYALTFAEGLLFPTATAAAAKTRGKTAHAGNSGIEGEGEADGLSDGFGVGEGEAVGIGVEVGGGELGENVMSLSLMGSSIDVTVPFCGKTE